MRRHLVLDCGDFPKELQVIFENIEIYGDIYAQGLPKRKKLASTLSLPIAAEGEKADWLLWIVREMENIYLAGKHRVPDAALVSSK